MRLQPARRVFVAAAYLLVVVLVIYAPTVGQGFVADDFGWLSATRPSMAGATMNAFSHTTGFYRPLVNRFSADPHLLARNIREYADGACSLSAADRSSSYF